MNQDYRLKRAEAELRMLLEDIALLGATPEDEERIHGLKALIIELETGQYEPR